MAMEPIYRAAVAPGGSTPFKGASAAAFGGAVGEAIEGVGGAITGVEKAIQRREQDREAAAAGVDLAQLRTDMGKAINDARIDSAPGAAGHAENIMAFYRLRAEELDKKYSSPRVKAMLKGQLADMGSRIELEESGYETGKALEKRVSDVGRQRQIAAANLTVNPSPAALGEAIAASDATIAVMSAPADVKERLKEEGRRDYALAWAQGFIEQDPKGALDVISTKEENPLVSLGVTADDIERLRTSATSEVRRLEAAELAKQRLDEAAKREKIAAFKAAETAGVEHSDAEIAEMETLATSMGDDATAIWAGALRITNQVRRETKPWMAKRYDEAIAELREKGENRTPEEDIRLRALEEIAPTRKAEFNKNPGMWAANNGLAPPPLDLADPKSRQARIQWRNGVAAATGRQTPYLMPEEVPDYREIYDRGPKGRAELAKGLQSFDGGAFAIARQIAPDDELFAWAVGLPGTSGQYALLGPDALKANPNVLDKVKAQDILNENAGAIPQPLRQAIKETAINIYAATMAEAGHTKWEEGPFRMAIHRALGSIGQGAGKTGGIGEYNDKPIWLPHGVTQEDFDGRMAGITLEGLVDAGGGRAPRWEGADGKIRVVPPEVFKRLDLVPIGAGRYQVVTASGAELKTKEGEPYILDASKLPRRGAKPAPAQHRPVM